MCSRSNVVPTTSSRHFMPWLQVARPTISTAGRGAGINERLDALADFIEANADVGRLLSLAVPGSIEIGSREKIRPPAQRIALARDAAFSFVYPHLLAGWRDAGAEIIPFSPLADE